MTDPRGASLRCPRCGDQLAPFTLAEGEEGDPPAVQVCRVCRGVWFDWFAGEASGLARCLDTDGAGRVGRSGPGVCPRDGQPLAAQPYLDTGPLVERCPACLGLFAPRGAIAHLQAFHERLPVGGPEPIERSLWARLWHAFAG